MDDVTAGRLIRLMDLTREIQGICEDELRRANATHTNGVLKWRFDEILTDAQEIEKRLRHATLFLLESHENLP